MPELRPAADATLDPALLLGVYPLSDRPLADTDREQDDIAEIGRLVIHGDYHDAATRAAAMWAAGDRDVRVVGYFLHGVLMQRGLASLPQCLAGIEQLLTINWEQIGPPVRTADALSTALQWLFGRLVQQLDQRGDDGQPLPWLVIGPENEAQVRDALDTAARLRGVMQPRVSAACLALYDQLLVWLQAAVRAESTDVWQPELREPPPGDEDEGPAARPSPNLPWLALEPVMPVMVEGSIALGQLLRKLQAFEVLAARGDYERAVIVFLDVQQVIERFDPRVYLPRVLAPFFKALSAHVDQLEPLIAGAQALPFRTLEQLYQVDLEAFMRK
jgi:hypothetical protein